MLKTTNCESCAKKVTCKYEEILAHIKSKKFIMNAFEDGPFNVTIECPYFELSPKSVNQCNVRPIIPSPTFTIPMTPPFNGYRSYDMTPDFDIHGKIRWKV